MFSPAVFTIAKFRHKSVSERFLFSLSAILNELAYSGHTSGKEKKRKEKKRKEKKRKEKKRKEKKRKEKKRKEKKRQEKKRKEKKRKEKNRKEKKRKEKKRKEKKRKEKLFKGYLLPMPAAPNTSLLNNRLCLAATFGVTKLPNTRLLILATLCCYLGQT
jgi:hypothetical protein